jgi:hypothetical protein
MLGVSYRSYEDLVRDKNIKCKIYIHNFYI